MNMYKSNSKIPLNTDCSIFQCWFIDICVYIKKIHSHHQKIHSPLASNFCNSQPLHTLYYRMMLIVKHIIFLFLLVILNFCCRLLLNNSFLKLTIFSCVIFEWTIFFHCSILLIFIFIELYSLHCTCCFSAE